MTKEKKVDKKKLINDVAQVLHDVLGGFTVERYKEFYMERTPKEIVMSSEELLSELLGPKQAKERMKNLYLKYDLKKL
ncbi:MAG: hypothetical protein GF349_00375 [Candidatus Magasanikbacteria bacterium]|nr:hypothetical protein [Candidatus Magasanikbacteria bacterium]